MEALLHRLSVAVWESVDALLRRKRVDGTRMTVTRYSFGANGRFPDHRHDQEQIAYLLSGRLVFTVEGRDYGLEPGDLIVIPAGSRHSALAGSQGAEVLSVVSPARRGEDDIELLAADEGKE